MSPEAVTQMKERRILPARSDSRGPQEGPWRQPAVVALATAAAMCGLGRLVYGRKSRRQEAREAVVHAELRLANERLQAMVEELQRSDRIKGEFLNTVSHDLRIPLTTIVGHAELLEDRADGHLSPEQSDSVEAILTATERMRRLLEDLLDFARMEAGRFRLEPQWISVPEVLREAVEGIRPLAACKKQTLEAFGDTDIPGLFVDPGRILQILNNLLSNAVKFTPTGGRITVAWHHIDNEVQISVSDTGIGIPKELQPRLFSKFFRVDQPGASTGHGLGLAIAQALAKAHGGHVEVESSPGKGSRFTVHLPLGAQASSDGHGLGGGARRSEAGVGTRA